MSQEQPEEQPKAKSYRDYMLDAHAYQVVAADTDNDSVGQLAAAVMAHTSSQLAHNTLLLAQNTLIDEFVTGLGPVIANLVEKMDQLDKDLKKRGITKG